MCQNGSKVASKFGQHHIFGLPHPSFSPDLSPCDFWLFDLLKGIMNGREFHFHVGIEEAMTVAWYDFIFEDVQSIFSD
jgi:hypothetical protein